MERRKILVVDGSNLSRTVLRSYLKKELPEAAVDLAGSGDQALKLLSTCEECYSLVTTSLVLPDMDGLEVCKAVRATDRHRFAPVVVVSSDADERLVRGGFAAGVTEFFDKSRGIEALGEFIKDFVQRSPGRVGNLLYVEDSKTAAVWGRKIMERHGLTVCHFESAEAAMLSLKDAEAPLPDLVVTDYFLSGEMTGEDLLRFIRADLRLLAQELPVLVVTGQSGEERHAEVLLKGASDFIEKPIVEEILMARIRSLLLIKQSFDALRRQSEDMHRMALTDSLTGVRNKRYLLDHGDEWMGGRGPVSVLVVDIDHFKQINDTHGHLLGDRVLAAVGELLRESFPDDGGSVVCRFGGEEFIVVLKNTVQEQACRDAELLRERIAESRPAATPVTVSIGVAAARGRDDTLSGLIARADEALYRAKQSGRNRVCHAEPVDASPVF